MSTGVSPSRTTSVNSQGLWAAARTLCKEPLYWLLAALPLTVALEQFHAGSLALFLASAVAIVPLAGLMGRATESLARILNPSIGGLLNATFGNAGELILGVVALSRGPEMYPLVKASLTGSIIGNVLLVMGASIFAGGIYFPRQTFNRTAAGMGATLLALASVGLLMPALVHHLWQARAVSGGSGARRIESLSEEIAVVLASIYVLSLIFTLVTHRDLFSGEQSKSADERPRPEWSLWTALTMLLMATVGVAWMSHLVVDTVEQARVALGMNEVFVGVIIVAVIGNAAEHSTAVRMALKNQMDATVQIAVGSAFQVALFVAPVLVFTSMFMGHAQPLDLHFSLLETITVVISVVVLALVCQDGETHWMEGAMMLGVYVIIALAFYNLPA